MDARFSGFEKLIDARFEAAHQELPESRARSTRDSIASNPGWITWKGGQGLLICFCAASGRPLCDNC